MKIQFFEQLHVSLKPAAGRMYKSGLTEMACKAAGMGSEASAKDVCSIVLIDTTCLCSATATAALMPCTCTSLLVLVLSLACAAAGSFWC